jgi:hypothetical protein
VRIFRSIPAESVEANPFPASASSASSASASSSAYVRRARRLRATLGDQPARLHSALRQFPMQRPAPAKSAGEVFAESVADSLEGGILRYSARCAMLRQAAKLGIDRFEANLIIATVQYRSPAPSRRPTARGRRFPSTALTIIAIQAAIVLVAWWLYSG